MVAKVRELKRDEIQVAQLVYLNNLPYYKIRIADDLGAGGAPWTEGITSTFVLHIGPEGYRNAISGNAFDGDKGTQTDEIFIHELAHVWQGSHGFQWEYWLDSIAQQGMLDQRAYAYLPGKAWDAYHAEQQAQIVQDWYAGAKIPNDPGWYQPMSRSSPLYRYITLVQTLPMTKPITYDP